jgi:hypothetical protein
MEPAVDEMETDCPLKAVDPISKSTSSSASFNIFCGLRGQCGESLLIQCRCGSSSLTSKTLASTLLGLRPMLNRVPLPPFCAPSVCYNIRG